MSNVSECIESGEMVGECRRKQDRSFYAQITYFICIKRSSLHLLNLPNLLNLLNSCKSCQTCLSRVWRVRAKWLANVGRMYRVRAKQGGKCWRMYRVRPIFQNGHFGEYSNSLKLANFWRVLEFDKFAGEWPLLRYNTTGINKTNKQMKTTVSLMEICLYCSPNSRKIYF